MFFEKVPVQGNDTGNQTLSFRARQPVQSKFAQAQKQGPANGDFPFLIQPLDQRAGICPEWTESL
jgi:hypothetical protein